MQALNGYRAMPRCGMRSSLFLRTGRTARTSEITGVSTLVHLFSGQGLRFTASPELHRVSVDTTLSDQEPRGAEGWTKKSKGRTWLLGLWAARASDARPRCPWPGTRGRSQHGA